MPTIQRGASLLLTRRLQQANGAALEVAGVLAITCELIQGGAVKLTLVLGSDTRLRGSGSSLLLELTDATTAQLARGQLTERYTLTLTAPEYIAQAGRRTVKLDIAEVVLT